MRRGTRTALTGIAAALFTAWCAAQLVLTHRAVEVSHLRDLASYHRFVQLYGADRVRRPLAIPTRAWLEPALASIIAAVALVLVAAVLVRGGRRWWAAVVVVAPAANAWRGWEDGRPLGQGWMQFSDHFVRWQVAGTVLDTLVLGVVVAALVATVRAPAVDGAPRAALLRVVPPMLILTGWWFDRNPLPDQVHEIWLLQALAYVLAVGLLASARLSIAVRAAAVLVVLPFCAVATAGAAIDSYGFVLPLVHHDLFALSVATYVLGMPALARAVRTGHPRALEVPSGG